MEVDLIFKIAMVGIIVSVVNILLKKAERDEQAMMITIAGLVIVLVLIINQISGLFDTIQSVFDL